MPVKAKTAVLLSSILVLLSVTESVLQMSVSGIIYLTADNFLSIIIGFFLLIGYLGFFVYSFRAYREEQKHIMDMKQIFTRK